MLDDIDAVYTCCFDSGQTGWEVFRVRWVELEKLHEAVKLLEAELRVHDLEEEWAGFTGFYKRFRFFLTTTPLAPHELLEEMEKWKFSRAPSHIEGLRLPSIDDLATSSGQVTKAFEQLLEQRENVLWRAALERIPRPAVGDEDSDEDGNIYVAVVCPNTRLKDKIAGLLDSLDEGIVATVLRPAELKNSGLYHQIIVFGPASRHHRDGTEYIFKSPRADSLVLYTPSFFPTKIPEVYEFAGSVRSFAGYGSPYEISSFSAGVTEEIVFGDVLPEEFAQEEVEPDNEWLKSLPVLKFSGRNGANGEDEMDEGVVVSRPLVLASDSVAFLPEDGWIYRVVECEDPESGGYVCETVEHIRNAEVTVGDAVLFSTEGGGDMVEEVADELLGKDRDRLRGLQRMWTLALLEKVQRLGLVSVARELRRMGAGSAQRLNVKNWCMPWNIAPGNASDFEIVLSYCDLGGRSDEIIKACSQLRSAHRAAGFRLSKRLIEVMGGRNLDELFAHGVQVFGGGNGLSNAKTAYLVEMVIREPVDVPRGETMTPKPLSENSWL